MKTVRGVGFATLLALMLLAGSAPSSARCAEGELAIIVLVPLAVVTVLSKIFVFSIATTGLHILNSGRVAVALGNEGRR
jgi:hypothetical protein